MSIFDPRNQAGSSSGPRPVRDGAAFDRQFRADSNLVKRLDSFGRGLTGWEVDFVESLVHWIDAGKCLTEDQRKVAERIDDEKVGT